MTLGIGFAGTFAGRIEAAVRSRLDVPCTIIVADEQALFRALAEGRIAGAALDVWSRYPTGPGLARPGAWPFHELPNVLMTPHVAGWTEGMVEARAGVIAENIRRVARGEPPLNLVPPRAG